LFIGLQLTDPGFQLINSLKQEFQRLLVDGRPIARLLRVEGTAVQQGQEAQDH
jgi:hypothetical protein